MATSSTKRKTTYVSGSTIVTADVANSWYGGLNGTAEGYAIQTIDPLDPRVIGHVHDGEPYDGHAGKINLVDHVTGQLLNLNLADDAVEKRNVKSFLASASAIPEYEVVGSDTYYYLDLSTVYSYIDSEIAGLTASPFKTSDTTSPTGDDAIVQVSTDYSSAGLDFVFGSSKLDDLASGTNGDSRFLFDRSKSAFRAGAVDSTQWDDAQRGLGSAAFGFNNISNGTASFVAGQGNASTADSSAVFGINNIVTVSAGSFVGGTNNFVSGGNNNAVFGEQNKSNNDTITKFSTHSTIGGFKNGTDAPFTTLFGQQNAVYSTAHGSTVVGERNATDGPLSLVFGNSARALIDGEFTHASGQFSPIVSATAPLGEAQTTEYTARGRLTVFGGAPNLLSVDGLGKNYPLQLDSAYFFHIMLVGKKTGATANHEMGCYEIKGLAAGPSTAGTAAQIFGPIMVNLVYRTPYFTAGAPNVNFTLGIGGGPAFPFLISVADSTPITPVETRWVATVRLTKCLF